MVTFPSLSQNTKGDSLIISVNALKSMAKESRKCDSLRVAYNFQFATLQELVQSNLDYFQRVKSEQLKREELQLKLDESIKALRKKKNNWLLPTTIGTVVGLIGGIVLSN